jgi:hypothetical protein
MKALVTLLGCGFALVYCCFAVAQTPPVSLAAPPDADAINKMKPYDRYKEQLRRLDLPPDPKFKTKVDQADAAEKSCLKDAMGPLVRKGLRYPALADAACQACNQQVVASAKISFDANKHRFVDPDLNHYISEHRKFCSDFGALSLALDAPYQVMERTSLATFGSWRVEGQLSYDDALSYVLVSKDSASGVSLELYCRPVSSQALWLILKGPYKKALSGQASVYVTYSIDRESPKQVEGQIQKKGEIQLGPSANNSVGTLLAAITTMREAVFISVSAISARFVSEGFREAGRDWLRRCAP